MELSKDLVSQFVKITNDTTEEKKTESTLYGEAVEYNNKIWIKFDGSDILTPITTTTSISPGERVVATIKNHQVIVTGNVTNPSASTSSVTEVNNKVAEFETIITEDLTAERARIDSLVAENVTIKETLTAAEADIEQLEADNVTINETLTANDASIKTLEVEKLDAAVANSTYATIANLEATNADIYNLESVYGDFQVLTTNHFTAVDASIADLEAKKLDATSAEILYANIDFSNIGTAAMEYFYAQSGLIENVTVGDATITGTLAGVTIKGDLIEGGTVVADKLVILGEDGLYYKLNTNGETVESEQTEYNSLDGSHILAQSITASKINVDDLVAFEATIGGFNITEGSLYSGAKESIDNTTQGVYMDKDGQMNLGDSNNYLKYFMDEDGSWKLDISAKTIIFGSNSQSIDDVVTGIQTEVNDVLDSLSTTQSMFDDAQNKLDSVEVYTYKAVSIDGGSTLAYINLFGYIESGTITDGVDADSETDIRSSVYAKLNNQSSYIWNIADVDGNTLTPTTYLYTYDEENDIYTYLSSSSENTVVVSSDVDVYMRFTVAVTIDNHDQYTYDMQLSNLSDATNDDSVDVYIGTLITLSPYMSVNATDYEWELSSTSLYDNIEEMISELNDQLNDQTVASDIDALRDSINNINDQLNDQSITTNIDEIRDSVNELEDRLYNEESGDVVGLKKRQSYIQIEPSVPSISLITSPYSDNTGTKAVLTDEKISFEQNGVEGAYIGYVEGERSSMAATTTYVTEMFPRYENPNSTSDDDKWVGTLCWIARSNGHYSLKVVK